MRRSAQSVLASVVDYLYSLEAATQEEHELKGITLRMLGLIRRDLLSGTAHPLDQAAFLQVGSTFARWRERNLERQARLAWQLVPDYDPTTEKPPAEAVQGRVREMPRRAGLAEDPMSALPSTPTGTE